MVAVAGQIGQLQAQYRQTAAYHFCISHDTVTNRVIMYTIQLIKI